MTLVEFLRARLDEDAAEMNALADEFGVGKLIRSRSQRIIDIEAKRQIVKSYEGLRKTVSMAATIGDDDAAFIGRHMYAGLVIALHYLALPYADHPDYQQEWRP